MSLSSFLTPCPCSKCKGATRQSLVYVGPGRWCCPPSGERFDIDLKTKDRAKRRHAAYVRA